MPCVNENVLKKILEIPAIGGSRCWNVCVYASMLNWCLEKGHNTQLFQNQYELNTQKNDIMCLFFISLLYTDDFGFNYYCFSLSYVNVVSKSYSSWHNETKRKKTILLAYRARLFFVTLYIWIDFLFHKTIATISREPLRVIECEEREYEIIIKYCHSRSGVHIIAI